jgi:flagellar hook assembly protein FlgD
VRELVDGKRTADTYRVEWDGKNQNGEPVASGVYFVRLTAGSFSDTKKLVLLR